MCGCGRKPKCNFTTGLQPSHGPGGGGGGMSGATSLEREAEVVLQVWEWWLLKFALTLRTLGTPHVPPCTIAPPPPPKKNKGKAPQKKRKRFESDSDSESNNPTCSSSSSSGEDTPPPPRTTNPPKSKAVPAPKEKGREKKAEGGGKETGVVKKEEGGRGAIPSWEPPPTSHTRGGGAEVGTVTGVHTRKSMVVWVRYPNDRNLYEVERHLIFGTAAAAEAHLQKVCTGKTPTTNPPPPPQQQSRLTPRLTPKKTFNPTQIPPVTHLTPQAKPKLPWHYGTRKRAPGRFTTATMAGMAKHMSRDGERVYILCVFGLV